MMWYYFIHKYIKMHDYTYTKQMLHLWIKIHLDFFFFYFIKFGWYNCPDV